MSKIIISLIKLYQFFSRSLIRHNALPLIYRSNCRFYPSCSDYAIESVAKYGPWRGALKGVMRVLKCNPLTPINK